MVFHERLQNSPAGKYCGPAWTRGGVTLDRVMGEVTGEIYPPQSYSSKVPKWKFLSFCSLNLTTHPLPTSGAENLDHCCHSQQSGGVFVFV